MRADGADIDDCPTIFTRYGEMGMSRLNSDGHEAKFKIQDGLQMLYMQKSTEDDLNACPVVVLKSDIIYTPKDLSYHYISQNCAGAGDL